MPVHSSLEPLHCCYKMAELHSERGRPKFTEGGYIYVYDKKSTSDSSITFWRCENKKECKGRVHVKDGKVIKMVRDHFHAPCGTSVNVAKVVAAVKRTAAQRELHTSTVVNMAMAGTSEAVQALAPVNRNLKQTVYRVRKKLSPHLPSPSDLAGLVIPEQFRFYKYNITQKEPYLLSDSGPTEKRILIFGRQSWLRFLAQSPVCYGDGTFKLAPPMFHQVFVLMAKRQGGIFPIVYVLLPDKRQVTYKKMFDMIIELVPEFQPMKFSCDFEMAVINAVKMCFPTVRIHGCFFHLAHNIFKKLVALGLKEEYTKYDKFALQARMIAALSFVPTDKLPFYFEELKKHCQPELMPLLTWFHQYYIGTFAHPPMFHRDYWNQHQRVLDGDDRTNNYVESAHRKVYRQLDVQHPNLWKFIDGLRRIQIDQDCYYRHLVAKRGRRVKRGKIVTLDKSLTELADEPMEFLEGVANTFIIHK